MSRVKTSHGYIIIYVGKYHHLADCRGYAYEHRIVAEQKIGRKLKKGEQVHHKDDNRENNNPDNLKVTKSGAHHLFLHRKEGSNKKHPDQNNYKVLCMCGCGESFYKYDSVNRPRDYISGHNPSETPTQDKILALLIKNEPLPAYKIKEIIGSTAAAAKTALCKMSQRNQIVRVKKGWYGKIGSASMEKVNLEIECGCGCGGKFMKYDKYKRERKYISGHNN